MIGGCTHNHIHLENVSFLMLETAQIIITCVCKIVPSAAHSTRGVCLIECDNKDAADDVFLGARTVMPGA